MSRREKRRHRLNDDNELLDLILRFDFDGEMVTRDGHFRVAVGRDEEKTAILTAGERRQSHAESLPRANRLQRFEIIARHRIRGENLI